MTDNNKKMGTGPSRAPPCDLQTMIKTGTKTELGQGSQGIVYKIQNSQKGCIFAAKVYVDDRDYSRESEALTRLREKCQSYVVCFTSLEKVELDGKVQHWLVTEYLQDYTELDQLIGRHPHESVLDKIEMYKDLIDGLNIIHEAGIAHMDVKPENIMVNVRNGQIKYIDFGIACLSGKGCIYGGSEYTMAPEIYAGFKDERPLPLSIEEAQRADIWSLGITMWMCKTNQLEQVADSTKEHMIQCFSKPFVPNQIYGFSEKKLLFIDLSRMITNDPKERKLDYTYQEICS